jgi:hypothetical protein
MMVRHLREGSFRAYLRYISIATADPKLNWPCCKATNNSCADVNTPLSSTSAVRNAVCIAVKKVVTPSNDDPSIGREEGR